MFFLECGNEIAKIIYIDNAAEYNSSSKYFIWKKSSLKSFSQC